MAAGAVYGLEAELRDLDECARSVSGATSDMELSFLEEQVASAAAKVQQSELQVRQSWTERHYYLLIIIEYFAICAGSVMLVPCC